MTTILILLEYKTAHL